MPTSTPPSAGCVRMAPEDIRDLILHKRQRIDKAEAQEHENAIRRRMSYNPARRMFWRPWKWHPAMTYERAKYLHHKRREIDGYEFPSNAERITGHFDASRSRCTRLAYAANRADDNIAEVLTSVEELAWLGGAGDGNL